MKQQKWTTSCSEQSSPKSRVGHACSGIPTSLDVDEIITDCLQPSFRKRAKIKAGEITSGGRDAAVAITEQIASVRANRPLASAIPQAIKS